MSLTAGSRLGPYEVLALLGAGGMGEVYRARDTRLERTVAIKVLPEHLKLDADLRQRFEREAKTISQLSHAHICALYDVGQEGETEYLVMEYLEGETLLERLVKGSLPLEQTLRHGVEIADALAAAHRQGIVHRDLKPGNVMLTRSGVKLLDFGLAKLRPSQEVAPMSPPSILPTEGKPLTQEGTILGTFQYMAPEQLEGKEADARTDIFALGAVLYEMATGKKAFSGATQASLITAIMSSDPPAISTFQPMSPPALERVVKTCLAKDPEDRWQSAHDVAGQLRWIAEVSQAAVPAPIAARRKSRERLAWALAAVALIATLGLAWLAFELRPQAPGVIQAILDLPDEARLSQYASNVSISPDGRTIVFVAADSTGKISLWVRPLGSDVATQIPGAPAGYPTPFWSPDGRYVAFFSLAGKLVKAAVAGGNPTTICDARNGRGGSWNRDGTIVFAPAPEGPLMRVASGGGEPVAVTALDSARHESAHRFPFFLPDGDHFLFAALPEGPNGLDIYVGSLRSRGAKRVLTARSAPVYVEPGFLLFERDGRLMAQRFDAGRLELEGDPVAIANAPEPSDLNAEPVASASRDGRLAALRSTPPDTRLELIDRTGATAARYELPPAPWTVVRTAPDGRRAAVADGKDIWIVDLVRSVPMRFAATDMRFASTALNTGSLAVWSPDGSRIAFVSKHAGREEIHIAGLDGRADPVSTTEDAFKRVWDWSRDGRFIVFGVLKAETKWDLWLLPLQGDRKPVPYLFGPSDERWARVSPDGRWLAYDSAETGQREVYVQSFPRTDRKVRVSLDRGDSPAWARGGKELLYRRGRTVMVVTVGTGKDFQPGTPRPLFTLPESTSADVVADGKDFLASVATETRARDIRLILNWTAMLKR